MTSLNTLLKTARFSCKEKPERYGSLQSSRGDNYKILTTTAASEQQNDGRRRKITTIAGGRRRRAAVWATLQSPPTGAPLYNIYQCVCLYFMKLGCLTPILFAFNFPN